MGGVFKRKGRSAWHYKLRLRDGTWCTRVGFSDKRATEEKKAREQRAIDRAEVGLVDPFAETREASLLELVKAYGETLSSRARATRYVAVVVERLSVVCRATGARVVTDLDPQTVEAFLARLLRGDLPAMKRRSARGQPVARKPVSMRTRDGYVEALRSFGAWLEETDRWATNPFTRLRNEARESDRTMEHRALSHEQLDHLVQAAPVRCVQEWVRSHPRADQAKVAQLEAEGWARGSLYLFAAYTGLRSSECAAVRRADLVVDGDEPHVVVRAATAKNRTEQRVPLIPVVVARLREHLARATEVAVRAGQPIPDAKAKVFAVRRGLLRALRKDAEHVGVGLHDDAGRRLTFHGFRASTATLLQQAGVSPAIAMRVLRHSDPRLTLQVYAKLGLADVHRELREKFMAPVAPQVAPNVVPLRAAVGQSWPLDQNREPQQGETEATGSAAVVSSEAASGRSVPLAAERANEAGSGGRYRSRTCDPARVSRSPTGPPRGDVESGTTGGTKDPGGGVLDPQWLPLRRALRDLLSAAARPHVPDDLLLQLEQLLDDQRPWKGGRR